jgi:MGT family glycosyltransferase
MARFLLATVPLVGHVTPGLSIARKLVERGHEVQWYTGKNFKAKIEATGAKFLPIKASLDYNELNPESTVPGLAGLTGLAALKAHAEHIFLDAVPGHIQDLKEILAESSADVILSDSTFTSTALLCEDSSQLWATFAVSPMGITSLDTAPAGLGIPPSKGRLGRLRNRLLYWFAQKIIFRDVYAYANRKFAEVGLPPRPRDMVSLTLSPYLYMQPTVPAFEYPRSDLAPQVHFIGPFLVPTPPTFTAPAWWDELKSGRPVVHVTQGTLATNYNELLLPTLQALANEDVLVVATTGGKPRSSVTTEPLPANVRLEEFISHNYLLPHVSVMITNGGYGGVQQALANGVPLVGAGKSEDKPEVCSRIAWSGVGINLNTQTPKPAQIRAAVQKILANSSYKQKATQMQAEYAKHDAALEAVQLLEQLATTKKPVLSH